MSREPSWWNYVGGREADAMWAKVYVALRREGREISAQDLAFYLAAIERLAAGAYPRKKGHPGNRVNFWISAHCPKLRPDEMDRGAGAESRLVFAPGIAGPLGTGKYLTGRLNML